MDWAEASMRNLTNLVQEVLRSNVNMASRLKSLERKHPALATPLNASQDDLTNSEASRSRGASRATCSRFAFEKDLESSTVYQRAAVNGLRFSMSLTSSNRPSYLSGLSLSDISDVSAVALPIFPTELWNHHRYNCSNPVSSTTKATSLEAWYNPPAKV